MSEFFLISINVLVKSRIIAFTGMIINPCTNISRFTITTNLLHLYKDSKYDFSSQEVITSMATTAYSVKKLGVMSVAWFGAVVGLVVGIIMALIAATAGGAAAAMAASISGTIQVGTAAGVGIFIALVLLGGVFGLIAGAVIAAIYNFALGPSNGIEIHIEVKS